MVEDIRNRDQLGSEVKRWQNVGDFIHEGASTSLTSIHNHKKNHVLIYNPNLNNELLVTPSIMIIKLNFCKLYKFYPHFNPSIDITNIQGIYV